MPTPIQVKRIQTGMRIEKRIVKVLKALAEYLEMSLGDLIEGIVLHSFEGKQPFDASLLKKIEAIKAIYDLDLDASHSHKLSEKIAEEPVSPYAEDSIAES